MFKTILKIAMVGSVLAGCQTLCGDRLVFIRRDFKPIGADGSDANNKAFQDDKAACIAKVLADRPDSPMNGIDNGSSSIDFGLSNDPAKAAVIDSVKGCMRQRNYELVRVQGRSSG